MSDVTVACRADRNPETADVRVTATFSDGTSVSHEWTGAELKAFHFGPFWPIVKKFEQHLSPAHFAIARIPLIRLLWGTDDPEVKASEPSAAVS